MPQQKHIFWFVYIFTDLFSVKHKFDKFYHIHDYISTAIKINKNIILYKVLSKKCVFNDFGQGKWIAVIQRSGKLV